MESLKSAIDWGKDNGMFKFVTVMSVVSILAILVAAMIRTQIMPTTPNAPESRINIVRHYADSGSDLYVYVATDKETGVDVLIVETNVGVTSEILPSTPKE